MPLASAHADGPTADSRPLVLLRGGIVVDGTGSEPQAADVLLRDGVIADIGTGIGAHVLCPAGDTTGNPAAEPGLEVVDATDRLVMPGFIDAHSHTDVHLTDPDVQHALLRQGVTTVITGQDGVSHIGAGAEGGAWGSRYFAGINGVADPVPTLGERRTQLAGRTRVNAAHLLPHGSLRFQRAGLRERLEPGELRALRQDVEQGLADGAVGLSTGLQYIPGLLADTAELTEISRPLADAHRPYVTHMRGYEQDSDDGMGEVFAIAAGSGAAVHVSHLHAPLPVLDPLLRRAADAGVDLTFDSYPYLSGFSLLTVPLLPWNLLRLTPEDLAEHLGAPGAVDRMPAGWADHVQGELDRITLAGVPGRSDLEGLSLREAAEVLHLSGPASVLHLIASTTGAATAVFRQPPSSNEESVRALLRRDEHLGGSDGIVVGGHPHPRAWATFPRFLARHVRDLGDWSWPDAAVHLSARPGVRFGLGGRGLLRPGAPADVILVDPDHVQDVATYGDPRRLSAGIADVWVAGERVLRDGELVGGPSADALPGRLLTWEDRT